MAKTIKFNLICDDHPVRTLDDLREHFSIEDVLKYYQSGLLQKWLSVRGYEKELKAVTALSDTGDLEIIKKLIRIFEIETDESAIEQGVYILEYDRSYKEQLDQYVEQEAVVEQVISDYEEGFYNLIDSILQNYRNMAFIKAAVQKIDDHYQSMFDANYRTIFHIFYECAPMALFVMLMYDHMRRFYVGIDFDGKPYQETEGVPVSEQSTSEIWQQRKEKTVSKLFSANRSELYEKLCKLNTASMLKNIFGKNLKFFAGQTDNYWKDLESKDCKCMVLRIDYRDHVRSAGKKDQIFDSSAVNDKFVILDGIDYRSNMSSHVIYYLEV